MARMSSFFGAFPVTIKPPMSTLSPASTRIRVEMLTSLAALGCGLVGSIELSNPVDFTTTFASELIEAKLPLTEL